jgi:hypothetical protein
MIFEQEKYDVTDAVCFCRSRSQRDLVNHFFLPKTNSASTREINLKDEGIGLSWPAAGSCP